MERTNFIIVPSKVLDGLEAIRVSGKTNMLALSEVVKLATEMGFADAAEWVRNNRRKYVRGVFCGFKRIEGGAD